MDLLFPHKADDFMSNIPAKYAKLLEQAAIETGYKIIISEDATSRDGYPLPEYVAVYATSYHDHTKFWNRFGELKAKANEAQ